MIEYPLLTPHNLDSGPIPDVPPKPPIHVIISHLLHGIMGQAARWGKPSMSRV
jgi:hypothetical protein